MTKPTNAKEKEMRRRFNRQSSFVSAVESSFLVRINQNK